MSLESSRSEQEPSSEWKEQIAEAIQGAIEFYSVPQDHDLPGHRIVDFSPLSLGVDDRMEFSELSPSERKFIRETVFRELNVAESVDSQVVEASQADKKGTRREAVFRTDRSDSEDLYVHIVTFEESGEVDGLFIAPKEFAL